LTTCGSGGLVGSVTPPQPQQPQQPQQPRQQEGGLAVGDHVTWIGEDEDVPAGTVGVVMRLMKSGVVVKFPKGQWGFKPTQLRKASEETDSQSGDTLVYLNKNEMIGPIVGAIEEHANRSSASRVALGATAILSALFSGLLVLAVVIRSKHSPRVGSSHVVYGQVHAGQQLSTANP